MVTKTKHGSAPFFETRGAIYFPCVCVSAHCAPWPITYIPGFRHLFGLQCAAYSEFHIKSGMHACSWVLLSVQFYSVSTIDCRLRVLCSASQCWVFYWQYVRCGCSGWCWWYCSVRPNATRYMRQLPVGPLNGMVTGFYCHVRNCFACLCVNKGEQSNEYVHVT